MKKLFLAAVYSLLATWSAGAADQNPPAKQPVKALAPAPHIGLYPFTGSGFYWGIGTTATSTDASVSGQQTALQSLGGSIGVVAGYRWADAPSIAFALEGEVLWNNLGMTSTCQGASCSVTADFTALQRAKAIVPLSMLTSIFPNLPTVPPVTIPGFTQGQNTYMFVGLKEDDVSAALGLANGSAWQVSPGFGVGVENQAPNGVVLDVWGGYFNPASGFTFGGGANANMGRQYMVGASLLF